MGADQQITAKTIFFEREAQWPSGLRRWIREGKKPSEDLSFFSRPGQSCKNKLIKKEMPAFNIYSLTVAS